MKVILNQVRGKTMLKDRWIGQAFIRGRESLPFRAVYGCGTVTVELPGTEIDADVENATSPDLALWEQVETPIANAISSHIEVTISNEKKTEDTLTEWAAKYNPASRQHDALPAWRERFGLLLLKTEDFAEAAQLRPGQAFALLAWLNRRSEISIVRDFDGSPIGWHLYP